MNINNNFLKEKFKHDSNSMVGDISFANLQSIPGISPIALSVKQTFHPSALIFKKGQGKLCSANAINENTITYKNIQLLKKYVAPAGKILSTRSTGVKNGKKQRKIRQEILRARYLGLLHYVKY